MFPVYKERENAHFSLNDDGIVLIETPIFRFVEKLLYSYLTEEEKNTPPQKIRQ